MRWTVLALAATTIGLLGSDCFKPFAADLDGGIRPLSVDLDDRCTPLADGLPSGLAFEPAGDQLWVAEGAPPMLVPFQVDEVPPSVSLDRTTFSLPADSDGDGSNDAPMPILGGIEFPEIPATPIPLALLTATGYDEVLVFDAAASNRFGFEVSVPSGLVDISFPRLPAPDSDPEPRTGLSTVACLADGVNRLDSRGDEADPESDGCVGFLTSSTSGAALKGRVVLAKLFVSMANPGLGGQLAPDPHFLPGAVLVYFVTISIPSLDITIKPDPRVPVIYTSGFNPTHVTPYSVGTRNFILVTVSGAVGEVQDDDGTTEVEGGFIATSDAAIDVIDADTLRLVATIPLGRAGLAAGLVVHPTAPLAVVGSMLDRWVLAVDLTPLADAELPTAGPPVVLGGAGRDTDFADAVIHDAASPYRIDHWIPDGASKVTCPGFTSGVAFNHAGDGLYVTDYCDGTLAAIGVDAVTPSLSLDHELFRIANSIDTPDAAAPRGLGGVAVRPKPLSTFTGPDVFVLVGEPEGLLCALSVESGP